MYAKISELKTHFSKYLAKVRNGATVVVCDRNRPIAKVIPIDNQVDGLQIDEPEDPRAAQIKGVPLQADVDTVRLLRESRDHR